jgi:4-hydroxy-2-oxoheptanedioate aldolase
VSAGLKNRLRSGERLLGVLVRMPAEELLEMSAVAGFDFVLIDSEHGPGDVVPLRNHLALAEAHGVGALVRVGHGEAGSVLRVLDAGAEGIIAPHIDTAEQAKALVDSAHYPPLGQRGFASYGRTGRFGRVAPDEHRQAALDNTLVFGMIESPLGVLNAAAIFAVPGLDGTMVGPADLRASSTAADPDPADSIRKVHGDLAASGGYRMDIVNGVDQAGRAFEDGAHLVVYNLTHTLMDHLAGLRAAGWSREEPS